MSSAELGPIWRSLLRQKLTFALVVIELAAGFVVISALVMFGAFVLEMGRQPSGHLEEELVAVNVAEAAVPRGRDDQEQDHGWSARGGDERAQLAALPGVVAVTPLSISLIDDRWYLSFPVHLWRDDERPPPRGLIPPVDETGRAEGWLIEAAPAVARVLGLTFLEGTAPSDDAGREGGGGAVGASVLITRCLRDALFGPGAAALGRTLVGENLPPSRVAGVVEDVLMQSPFLPAARCLAFRFDRPPDPRERRYILRVRPGHRSAVIEAARAALGTSGPNREILVNRFDSRDGKHHAVGRGVAIEMAMIGGTVGVGALVGALALSSFLVRQRRRQIAIRRALGARKRDIIRYFLVESTLATAVGTGIGVGLMLAGLTLAGLSGDSQTYFTWSWRSLAASALLMWAVAVIAAMIPTRRALAIAPSRASRAV